MNNINISYFQQKLDSSTDLGYSVIDEMVELKNNLSDNRLLTLDDAINMHRFLILNSNAHINYVVKKEKNNKLSAENEVNDVMISFDQSLSYKQRYNYISLLLDKSNNNFNNQLKHILKNNMDIVEQIRNLASIEMELDKIDYPIAICDTECECYGITFNENEKFGYNMNYEPMVNYIEFQLFTEGKMIGLIDAKTFLKNFIYE